LTSREHISYVSIVFRIQAAFKYCVLGESILPGNSLTEALRQPTGFKLRCLQTQLLMNGKKKQVFIIFIISLHFTPFLTFENKF
jgi:hypothetical protein